MATRCGPTARELKPKITASGKLRKSHRSFTGVDDGSEDSADMFTLRG